MGESQAAGVGPVGLEGAAASGFWTGADCTVPGMGLPAAGFGWPVGGGVGDLVSSDMAMKLEAPAPRTL